MLDRRLQFTTGIVFPPAKQLRVFILSRPCDVFRAPWTSKRCVFWAKWGHLFCFNKSGVFLGVGLSGSKLLSDRITRGKRKKTIDPPNFQTRQQSVAKWQNVSTLSPFITLMDRREVEEEEVEETED